MVNLPRQALSTILPLAILLLAFTLRVYGLDVIPPGLHYDEAFNALSAEDINHTGQLKVFFAGDFGEEPLHITTLALLFRLTGDRVWTVRLTSALYGLFFVAGVYFAAGVLLQRRRAALIAAFIAATIYWSLNFARIGIETITLAALITLHLGSLYKLLDSSPTRSSGKWVILTGLFAGAVYYTYLASRVTPLVLAIFGVYLLVLHRDRVTSRWKSVALASLVALVTVAPLAWFFINNPTAFYARAGQVLTPELFGSNLLSTAGMFFFRGDIDPRDNLPGRPALDILLAFFFVIGLLVSLKRWRQPQYFLLVIWLLVLTAPAVISEYAPNFRRATGALPAIILLCALGADESARRLSTILARAFPRRRTVAAEFVLVTSLILSAGWSTRDYFIEWANGTGLYYSFDAGLLRVGEFLAARPSEERLCISPNYPDHPTLLWALKGRDYFTFDGRRVAVLPDSALPTTCAIITYEDQVFTPTRFYPATEKLATFYDFADKPYAEIFRIPAGAVPTIEPQVQVDVRVGEGIHVGGYDVSRAGKRFDVKIFWRAGKPLKENYTVFVHLLGPVDPTTKSTIWAQDDSQTGHNTYPTSRWRTGETIVDQYTLILPDRAPAGDYQIEVGMYLLSTGERLPILVNGVRSAQDRWLITELPK
jgi:4-amino-4-deoxy-L-arabinose transferase-like glycosyltransferase